MEEKKLNNLDLEILVENIRACGNQSIQPFRNKMLRNMETFTEELKKVYATMEEPAGFDAFKEKETKVVQAYAIGYDKNNQPIFGENQEAAQRELKALKEDNSVLVEKLIAIKKDFYKTVMTQPVECKVRFIMETEIPKPLTLEQGIGIGKLIIYTDDENPAAKKKAAKT